MNTTIPDDFVNSQIEAGIFTEEIVAPEITGLPRPITILRAPRKNKPITFKWHGDGDTFCPPQWFDLGIGSGPCGLGCRACFLTLTFRALRDPWRPVVYDNYSYFADAVKAWLKHPDRRPQHTMGLGIDRADSLLLEGVTGHARRLIPLFGDKNTNPAGCKLVLLTKTANVHYLAEVPENLRQNTVVSFSLNPEPICDLWEGKYPDTGERISPSADKRLTAALEAQLMGYPVRIRLDPILTPSSWENMYFDFIEQIWQTGIQFDYWTLGTYREKLNNAIASWGHFWGMLPMEWELDHDTLVKDGTHWRASDDYRFGVYSTVRDTIRRFFPGSPIGLCKETHQMRKKLGLTNACCNCLR